MTQEKFILIEETWNQSKNQLSLSRLCQIAGVSRSGYYHWLKVARSRLKEKQVQDEKDFMVILEAYNHRGFSKGSRGIYMYLVHKGQVMNRKKILRLMAKFNLKCPIRRQSKHKQAAQKHQAEAIKENIVQREFKAYGPRQVLLTDITYCFYGNHQRAYLSTIKDAYTNEILAYQYSQSLAVDFVLDTINQLVEKEGVRLSTSTIIHSDQGSHYTSIAFQELVEDEKLRQSMSRRGNCWDNAPQESFFGHMKDELNLSACKTFNQFTTMIDDYMDYYNNERYQWGLAKLSPRQYYQYYLTGKYPLENYLDAQPLPEVRTREIEEPIVK